MNLTKILTLRNYLRSSKWRLRVLRLLAEDAYSPAMIAIKLNIDPSMVSKVLKQLEDKNLIFTYNPHIRKGKAFFLTQIGEKVLDNIENKLKKELL